MLFALIICSYIIFNFLILSTGMALFCSDMTVMSHSESYLIQMDDFFFKHHGEEGEKTLLTTSPEIGVGAIRIFPSPCLVQAIKCQ